jgi:circadian clock protein KaiC
VITGGPGTGKTTLAQQILFANTSAECPGVYFSGPGNPMHRLLRRHDIDWLNRHVRFVHLGDSLAERDAARVVDTLVRETIDRPASFVVVDLVRSLIHPAVWTDIVRYLTGLEATTILIADCDPMDSPADAALSSADGIVWLRHSPDGYAASRTVQALKIRGQEPLPGPHAMRVTREGVRVFPRWPTPQRRVPVWHPAGRLSVGIAELDRLMGGGAPVGGTLLVEGPAGMGKSILASQFLAESGHQGLPGLALLFEERPDRFIARAEALDLELERLNRCGLIEVLSFRGRDLSTDELIFEVQRAVTLARAECVAIDSTAGLELILNGGFQLADCLWRLLDALRGMGVTLWLNNTPDAARPSLTSFVDDVIELQRFEHNGRVEKRLEVVKVSCNAHSAGLHAYEIGEHGFEMVKRDDERPTNGHVIDYNGMAVSRSA